MDVTSARRPPAPRKRALSPLPHSAWPSTTPKRVRIRGPTREGHARYLAAAEAERVAGRAAAAKAAHMLLLQRQEEHRLLVQRQPEKNQGKAEDKQLGEQQDKHHDKHRGRKKMQGKRTNGEAGGDTLGTPSPASTVEETLPRGDLRFAGPPRRRRRVHAVSDTVSPWTPAEERKDGEEGVENKNKFEVAFPQVESLEEVSDGALVEALTSLLEALVDTNMMAGRARTCDEAAERLRLFFSKAPQSFPLESYVERVVLNVPSRPVLVTSLVLLDRLCASHCDMALSFANMHRIFLTSVLLAYKVLEDEPCSQDFFRIIGGVPSLDELNDLEAEFLRLIDWRCLVDGDVYDVYRGAVLASVIEMHPAGVPRQAPEAAVASSA